MELLKNSDKKSFTEIYERYWKTLLAIAYNRLKRLHEAEDAVHDVLVGLWKTRNKQEIIELKNYLSVALKYSVLRIIYRRRIFSNTKNVEDDLTIHNDKNLEDKDILTLIWNETEDLPEKCRIIFRLSRFDGLTNLEIAVKLNISSKTVENQINKAQKRIKVSLKNILGFIALLFFIC